MTDDEEQPFISEQRVALTSATVALSGLPSVIDRELALHEIECYGSIAAAYAALPEDERLECSDATRLAITKAIPPTTTLCPGVTVHGGHCSAALKPGFGTCGRHSQQQFLTRVNGAATPCWTCGGKDKAPCVGCLGCNRTLHIQCVHDQCNE